MKADLQALLAQALDALLAETDTQLDPLPNISIDTARNKDHGDFASNLAMQLAKPLGQAPRAIAEALVAKLPASEFIEKLEVAGPGFINFYLKQTAHTSVIAAILQQQQTFGRHQLAAPQQICIEFVSVNPTGPLHVGHGRGAAYGASLANLLEAAGHTIQREYYVNDAGRQMDILATSVWLRYLSLAMGEQEAPSFPKNGYQGDYIWDIAAQLHRENADTLACSVAHFSDLHPDEGEANGDKEKHIDDLITVAKTQLGQSYKQVFQLALHTITENIRQDLESFGVAFDLWFSEQKLVDDNLVDDAIETLTQSDDIYRDGNTQWFRSSHYGDEKDRVVVRENGIKTYFASDIAYHQHKLARGFDQLINIWGADHHGYITRVKAGMSALGHDSNALTVLLVQIVNLIRGGKPVAMSTRSGSYITLRELTEEVGNDAARFFYVMRKAEQHMDFDLDLAKAQNNDNPVYYIQYAHARVHSVLRELAQQQLAFDVSEGLAHLSLLDSEAELAVISKLNQYSETIAHAASQHATHQLAYYLRDLAQTFHGLYNTHKFIVDDAPLRNARLCLAKACAQVIANGLEILGVSAPEHM